MSSDGGASVKETLQLLPSAFGVFSYPIRLELSKDPTMRPLEISRRARESAPVKRFEAALEESVTIIKNGGGRDELRGIRFH